MIYLNSTMKICSREKTALPQNESVSGLFTKPPASQLRSHSRALSGTIPENPLSREWGTLSENHSCQWQNACGGFVNSTANGSYFS